MESFLQSTQVLIGGTAQPFTVPIIAYRPRLTLEVTMRELISEIIPF